MAYETVQITRKDSADVLVAFLSRGVEKGKFTFWKLLTQFGATLIFVNDCTNRYYL